MPAVARVILSDQRERRISAMVGEMEVDDGGRMTGDGCSGRGYWWSGRPAGRPPDGRCAPDSSGTACPQNDERWCAIQCSVPQCFQ